MATPQYFLTIDGIAGDSTADKHVGAFDVNDYSFDLTHLGAHTSGGGAGAGTTDFSPLQVGLDLGSTLTDLLKDAAAGTHIPSVELEGVNTKDGHVLYDLKLGDVTIDHIKDTNGEDQLSLNYDKVSLTTTHQNSDGSYAAPETMSWDIGQNKADATIPDPHPGHLDSNSAAPGEAAQPGAVAQDPGPGLVHLAQHPLLGDATGHALLNPAYLHTAETAAGSNPFDHLLTDTATNNHSLLGDATHGFQHHDHHALF